MANVFKSVLNSSGSGGGHVIVDENDTEMTQRSNLKFGEAFSVDDDRVNDNTEININELSTGAMDEIAYPLPTAAPGSWGKKLNAQTLAAGSTTLTFSDSRITTNSTIYPFVSVWGIAPTAISTTTGQVTLSFEAQSSAISVYLVVC